MTDDQARRLDIGARAIGLLAGIVTLHIGPVSKECAELMRDLVNQWNATFQKGKRE